MIQDFCVLLKKKLFFLPHQHTFVILPDNTSMTYLILTLMVIAFIILVIADVSAKKHERNDSISSDPVQNDGLSCIYEHGKSDDYNYETQPMTEEDDYPLNMGPTEDDLKRTISSLNEIILTFEDITEALLSEQMSLLDNASVMRDYALRYLPKNTQADNSEINSVFSNILIAGADMTVLRERYGRRQIRVKSLLKEHQKLNSKIGNYGAGEDDHILKTEDESYYETPVTFMTLASGEITRVTKSEKDIPKKSSKKAIATKKRNMRRQKAGEILETITGRTFTTKAALEELKDWLLYVNGTEKSIDTYEIMEAMDDLSNKSESSREAVSESEYSDFDSKLW